MEEQVLRAQQEMNGELRAPQGSILKTQKTRRLRQRKRGSALESQGPRRFCEA